MESRTISTNPDELLAEALDFLEERDYDLAYSSAVSALNMLPEGAAIIPDLLEVAAICCERYRTLPDSALPSDAELDKLTDIAMEEKTDPISTASALSVFGKIYYAREDLTTAATVMTKALRSVEAEEFEFKSGYLPDYEFLVSSLWWQGKLEDALREGYNWLSQAEAQLEENDIWTAKIHQILAVIYKSNDQPALAEEHLKRCLWLHENEQCDECADVVGALGTYAELLDTMGRTDEADELRTRAESLAESFGEEE